MEIVLDPSRVRLVGEGGAARVRQRYEGGAAVGQVERNGGAVRRIAAAALIEGLDLADVEVTVETSTPLEDVPAGSVWGAEGETTLRVRADGRSGFGDGGPRGALVGTVYVARIVPLGSLTELLARPARRGGEAAA